MESSQDWPGECRTSHMARKAKEAGGLGRKRPIQGTSLKVFVEVLVPSNGSRLGRVVSKHCW